MPDMSADACFFNYNAAKTRRNPFENDYRTAAAYCMPSHYGSWQTDGPMQFSSNAALRRTVFDSTGVKSLPKYAAVLERLATPNGTRWQGLRASSPKLMARTAVKTYFDDLTDLLFKMRNAPRANFRRATGEMYLSLGGYGNGPMWFSKRKPNALSRAPGFIYRSIPFRDVYYAVNDNGEIDTVYYRFWVNLRQFKMKFPNETIPACMQAESTKPIPDENNMFEIVHAVYPRADDVYDPQALDARSMSFVSNYLVIKDKAFVGKEEGFKSLPYLTPRAATYSGEPYGQGVAVMALASLGGASQMKKTILKQGNLAVDPVILAHDDGVLNGAIDLRPGHVNYGGVNKQGQPLIHALQGGNFQVGEVLLESEQKDTEDLFLVSLFQIFQEAGDKSATQIIAEIAEQSALLSPTAGSLQTEWLGPETDRAIVILDEMGMLPTMPPELIEAKGEYEIQYTSPLAKGMYAEEISGFTKAVDFSLSIYTATQNPDVLDAYNFDVATPEIADNLGTPARWINDAATIASKRDERSKQMQQQAAVAAAPAMASVAKTASQIPGVGVPGAAPAQPGA